MIPKTSERADFSYSNHKHFDGSKDKTCSCWGFLFNKKDRNPIDASILPSSKDRGTDKKKINFQANPIHKDVASMYPSLYKGAGKDLIEDNPQNATSAETHSIIIFEEDNSTDSEKK